MIRPELALLNIGVDNKYVYPIEDVIERYKKMGSKVYCADTYNTLIIGENGMKPTHNGTITFLTDGKRYEIKAENNLDEIQAELERARTSPPYRFPEISQEELAKEIPQENIDVSLILDGEYLDKVQSIINHAEESIYMIMFAVKPGKKGGNQVNKLLQELIAARRRGVRVKIILERSQTNKGFVAGANRVAYNIFAQEGLDVKFDFPKIKTHDKLLIIDREIVVIGSHNWTKAGLDGTQNEASVLIKSRAVAQKYLRYFYEYKWAEGPKERAEKRPQKRRRR